MQATPFTLPTLASGLLSAGTAFYVARWRAKPPAAREFVVTASAAALMCFAYAGELSASSLAFKLAWLDLRWVGICAFPVAGLCLVLRWDGQERWLQPRRLALLLAIPVATLLLAWADPWLHFVDGRSQLLPRPGYTLRSAPAHPGFWIYALYAYLCTVWILWRCGRAAWSSPLRRRQGVFLVLATLVGWVANMVYLLGHSPDPAFDCSHIGYGLACLFWMLGINRAGLFDLVPVARDRVFESLADAVIVLDAERRIVDHNPAAVKALGAKALAGLPLAAVLGEELAASIEQRKSLWLLGRELSVEASTLRGGRSTATVLTLRDVTLQRQIEMAREEALRLAEEAGKARAQFLARMSHEARGPLYGVVGAADLLLSVQLPPEGKRYADSVAASSRMLLALVDELLDFSKIDADRLRVDCREVDARECLDEVVALFAGAAEKKGLALRRSSPARLPVRADPVRLRQVLVNLVANAVKFTDQGGITLSAREQGARWRFEVVDTGIGIAPEAHARIFEPFIQLGAPTRSGPEGTGLGLGIARRLCELMQGELRVESRPGAGSTFWFTLPACEVTQEVDPAGIARPAAVGPRAGRVLVVDDEPVSRLVTSGLLAREGCEVETVESAEAALSAIAARAFALVVTDIRMPGMGGHALIAELRQRSGPQARTPVVALTGDVHDGARDEALRSGADAWLPKPAEPAKLREVLDRLLPSDAPAAPLRDLRAYLAADPETYARIREAFRASTPAEIDALLASAAAGSWDRVHALAHALKGACAVVGAAELAGVCAQLQIREGAQAEEALSRLRFAADAALARLAREDSHAAGQAR